MAPSRLPTLREAHSTEAGNSEPAGERAPYSQRRTSVNSYRDLYICNLNPSGRPNPKAWSYVQPAFGGTMSEQKLDCHVVRATVCEFQSNGTVLLKFGRNGNGPRGFAALISVEIPPTQRELHAAAWIATVAKSAIQLGASCVLISWPEQDDTVGKIVGRLSEEANGSSSCNFESDVEAIGSVPVAIIRAGAAKELKDTLQQGFMLKPYCSPHHQDVSTNHSGRPKEMGNWTQVTAGLAVQFRNIIDTVAGKPKLSGQLQQQLQNVWAEPSDAAKRLGTISLLDRAGEHRVDVDAVRHLLLQCSKERSREFAWLAVVAGVMRYRLDGVEQQQQLWNLPGEILGVQVANWRHLVPAERWEWSELTISSVQGDTLLHVLNMCLTEAFHEEQFTGSARMLAALSFLERIQGWLGTRNVETTMRYEKIARSSFWAHEPVDNILSNLQRHVPHIATPANKGIQIIRRGLWWRVSCIEQLTTLCSLGTDNGSTILSLHAASDAHDYGAVGRALRSAFEPSRDVAPALCEFMRLLSPDERHFDKIVGMVVFHAMADSNDGFMPLQTLHECIMRLGDMSPCAIQLKKHVTEHISKSFHELRPVQLVQWLNTDSFAAFGSPTAHELLSVIDRTSEPFGSVLWYCANVHARLPQTRTVQLPVALQSLVRKRLGDSDLCTHQLRHRLEELLLAVSQAGVRMPSEQSAVIAKALIDNVASTPLYLSEDTLNTRCKGFDRFRLAVTSIDANSEILGAAVDLIINATLPEAQIEADGNPIVACVEVDGRSTPAQEVLEGKLVLRCLSWCHAGFAHDALCVALSHIDEAVAHGRLCNAHASMLLKSIELGEQIARRGVTEVHEKIQKQLSDFTSSLEQLCDTIEREELAFSALNVCLSQQSLLESLASSLRVIPKWSAVRNVMLTQIASFKLNFLHLCNERAFMQAVADCGVECSQIYDCSELFASIPEGIDSALTTSAEFLKVQQWSPTRMAAAWRAAEAWLSPVKPHERFLHYFIESRSILFEHFLSKKMHAFRGNEAPSSEYFGKSVLGVVRHKLEKLLSTTDANFFDMKEASDKLSKANRLPSDELNSVWLFFKDKAPGVSETDFDMQRTLTGLKSVLQLGQLSTPLLNYTRAVHLYGFKCVTDSAFIKLEQIATLLNDPECMAAQTISECITSRTTIDQLLDDARCEDARSDDKRHEICLGLLLLFQQLSDATDVWHFVLERGYFGQEGLARFSAKLDLIANQGADEQLLNQLDPVVRIISTLVSARTSPTMKELMDTLRNDGRIMKEACCVDVHRFQFIGFVQTHIARLASWFDKGLGGIDAVFAQFKSISSPGSCYQFLLQSKEVQLKYTEVDTAVEMNGEALEDFVQRVGFVQKDEKARGLPIGKFLEEIQGHQKALSVMCQLRVLGHPQFQRAEPYDQANNAELRPLVLASEQTKMTQLSFQTLNEKLWQWRRRLEGATRRHASLRLYSTAEAQWIYERLCQPKSSQIVDELALIICPMYPRTTHSFSTLQRAIGDAMKNPKPTTQPERKGALLQDTKIIGQQEWPARVGTFLKAVQCAMEERELAFNPVLPTQHWHGVHVHTVDASAEALLYLILSIFKRLPKSFEVLWCERSTGAQQVATFLDRTVHETSWCFVMVHVDMLLPSVQQVLLRHLLASRDAKQQNLHFIQMSSTNLQAVPWIGHHKSLDASRLLNRELAKDLLRKNVLRSGCIQSVVWLFGGAGSGKTHLARKKMARWKAHGRAVFCMSITEAFSLAEAAKLLREAMLAHGPNMPMGLCFHINLGFFREREQREWDKLMALINRFFFNLLVLSFVTDPESGLILSIPPHYQLKVLVELPDRTGHLSEEPAQDARDPSWVFRELPVIALVGEMKTPPNAYDVDDDARLVCKYLKAYADGSIDSKYGGAHSVDLCFVMDCTGSMDQWIEQAQQKTLNLVTAAKQQFKVKVRVAFVAYRDYSEGDRKLDCMDFVEERDIPRLEAFIGDRCKAFGGGDCAEDVAGGLKAALGMSWRSGVRIVVHVADAPAHGNEYHPDNAVLDEYPGGAVDGTDPKTVVARLGSETGANFYFVSINRTTDTMVNLFKEAHRASGRVFKVYTLNDDATQFFDTMIDAVKRSVSEQIEAAGEGLSQEECRELLQDGMKLNTRSPPWSMLQQRYWVRYLHRRCHLLRMSDKFNKNDRFERFGSTTMQVMLEEVERALCPDYEQDWSESNQQQLVYWKEGDDVRWNLLMTRPDAMGGERAQLLQSLDMHVPTTAQLRDRKVLHTYLALGLGVSVDNAERRAGFDVELGELMAIDEARFVITLDFAMKMLCMNERIACSVPCIVEGETGVSKTALARMLFILKNADALGSNDDNNEEGILTLRHLIAQAQGERTRNQVDKPDLDMVALHAIQLIASKRFEISGANRSPGSPPANEPFIFTAFASLTHASGAIVSSTDAPVFPFRFTPARVNAAGTSQPNLVDFSIWSDASRLAAHLLSKVHDGALDLWQEMLDDILQDPGLDINPDLLMGLHFSGQGGLGNLSVVDRSKNDSRENHRTDDTAVLDAPSLIFAASPTKLGSIFLEYVRAVLQRTMHQQDRLDWTFFQLKVDSALTSADIISRLRNPVQRAERALRLGEMLDSKCHRDVSLCIFLDETNTSSCMGVFKELIVDQRLNGVDLPPNVVVISAINPARHRLTNFSGANLRREELAKEWATGHYQVHPLPRSIEMIKWSFGALSALQEKEFILKRMQMMYPDSEEFPRSNEFPKYQQVHLAGLIATSQELTRRFAAEHFAAMASVASQAETIRLNTDARRAVVEELHAVLLPMLPRKIKWDQARPIVEELIVTRANAQAALSQPHVLAAQVVDIAVRASSVVSLRDIMRVFSLFDFFNDVLLQREGGKRDEVGAHHDELPPLFFYSGEVEPPTERRRRAMLLALGVVYYLRLDYQYRSRFEESIHGTLQDSKVAPCLKLKAVLDDVMKTLISHTESVPGIARTQGLKENVFMVAMCLFAQIPLMIIGPPGSSKTLSVAMVAANAKGTESKSKDSFFRTQRRLIPFHYQCSNRSTSREIDAVFRRAIDRQKTAYGDSTCFVFMDEAGLPEEGRESLKVLHYYLEEHTSRSERVGFVAISNHMLDAAKSNRCATLLRTEPDQKELIEIARGCLGDEMEQQRRGAQRVLGLDLRVDDLLERLCGAYRTLMTAGQDVSASNISNDTLPPPKWFDTFFGLRDFMHFIKLLARLAEGTSVSLGSIQLALERNFNGRERGDVQRLVRFWLSALAPKIKLHPFRNPFDLLFDSLHEQLLSREPMSRYKLLIETTNDDSILRLLQERRILALVPDGRSCTVLKLSDFPEDSEIQQANVIAGAKYAAAKGETIVLSQTERINESFYDLFNQHFQRMVDRDEDGQPTVTYHANIAIGSHSKLCQVSPGFQCIVHLRLSELREAPAPFLNRFEKYRLTHAMLLDSHLSQRSAALRQLTLNVLDKVQELTERVGLHHFYGAKQQQTVESAIHNLLGVSMPLSQDVQDWSLVPALESELMQATFIDVVHKELNGDVNAQEQFAQLLAGDRSVNEFVQQALAVSPGRASREQHAIVRLGGILVGQWMLHVVIRQLLQVMAPEQLYRHRARLPRELLETYLMKQEHFSLKRLLRSLIEEGGNLKQLVWTRTSAAILALAESDGHSEAGINCGQEMLVCEPFELPGGELVSIANFAIYQLSQIATQEALTSALVSFFQDAQRRVFLMVVDMRPSECTTSRINFARLKIDELLSQHEGSPKTFVLLLHCPASDMSSSNALYDTTFSDGWRITFLDAVSEEASVIRELDVCEWLKLGCHLADGKQWSLLPVLECCDGWLLPALTIAATRVYFPPGRSADGLYPRHPISLQKRLELLRRIFDTKLAVPEEATEVPVRHVVCRKYSELWAADNHRLIIDRVDCATHLVGSGEVHMSLVEAITGEIRDVFINYLTLAVFQLHEGLNVEILDCETLPTVVQKLFVSCLAGLPVPPITELKSRSHSIRATITYCPPAPDSMLPFFDFLAKFMDDVAIESFAGVGAESHTHELISDIHTKIRTSDHPAARVIGSHLHAGLHDELWRRYLAHFCARLYPLDEAASAVEHKMLAACLDGHTGGWGREKRIAVLHVAGLRYEQTLKGLAASIQPLARLEHELSTSDIDVEGLFGSLRSSNMLEQGRWEQQEIMHSIMIAHFKSHLDAALNSEGDRTALGLRTWAHVYGTSELQQVLAVSGAPFPEGSRERLAVMGAMHAVIGGCVGDDFANLQAFKEQLEQYFSTRLGLESMCCCLLTHFPDRPQLEQRLLEFWCRFSLPQHDTSLDSSSRADVSYFFSQDGPHRRISICAATSVLEAMLAGAHGDPVDDTTIEKVVKEHPKSACAEVLQIMEQQLRANVTRDEALVDTYAPPWFKQQADAQLDVPLAHAYFSMVLKQLLLHDGHCSLEEALVHYAKMEQEFRTTMMVSDLDAICQARMRRLATKGPPRLPCLRAVTLGAARMLIVLRLAWKISLYRDLRDGGLEIALLTAAEFELNVPQQMRSMVAAHHQWPHEFVHALCCELNSKTAARELLHKHKKQLILEIGPWIEPWTFAPSDTSVVWAHTRLSFAIDTTHALFDHYNAIARCVRDQDAAGLMRLVREHLTDQEERTILDLRMMLFAAIYDELGWREHRGSNDIAQAVKSLQHTLRLTDGALRLYMCVLDRTFMISRPEDEAAPNQHPGRARDSLYEMFTSFPTTRSDRELQACVAGMLAVVLGMREGATHLHTHVYAPGRLRGTHGVCFQYSHRINEHGFHYDCGCELFADGNLGRIERPPWTRHSYWFALWASYAALAAAVVMQPGAQDEIHLPEGESPVFSHWQPVRHVIHSVMQAAWHHMATKWGLESEMQCLVVLRTFENMRERSLVDPAAFPSVFMSQAALQEYEGELQSCLNYSFNQLRSGTSLAPLQRMQDVGNLWLTLDAYSEVHPPLQIVVRHSDSLLPQHKAFTEALEVVLSSERQEFSVLATFTRSCHRLRFLWVLPDLIELYDWLHATFDQVLKEDKAKEMSVRDMLDSMETKGRFDDTQVRRIHELWSRAKVGYNQFVRLMGYRIGHGACGAAPEAAADEARLNRLDELDDGQPLWCLLTKHASEDEVDMVSWQTDDGTRALRNDCLFEVIKRMIQMHNDFVRELTCDDVDVSRRNELKPLELRYADIALGDNLACEGLRIAPYSNGPNRLHESLLHIDQCGVFAKIVQRHWDNATHSFSMAAVQQDVEEAFLRRLIFIGDPSSADHLRRVCRFRKEDTSAATIDAVMSTCNQAAGLMRELEGVGLLGNGSGRRHEELETLFFEMLHSMEYEQLQSLVRGLNAIIRSALQSGVPKADETVGQRLQSMFPNTGSDKERIRLVHIELQEDRFSEQSRTLLQSRFEELPSLLGFLQHHLREQDYTFAHVSSELKRRWGPDIDEWLGGIEASMENRGYDMAVEARKLDAALRDYEAVLASTPERRIHTVLAEALMCKEETLSAELPLMGALPGALRACHLVELRKQLHCWAARRSQAQQEEPWQWDWPFLVGRPMEAGNRVGASTTEEHGTAGRLLMWFESEDDLVVPAVRFLINDLVNELELREAAAKKKFAAACVIQVHARACLAEYARVAPPTMTMTIDVQRLNAPSSEMAKARFAMPSCWRRCLCLRPR